MDQKEILKEAELATRMQMETAIKIIEDMERIGYSDGYTKQDVFAVCQILATNNYVAIHLSGEVNPYITVEHSGEFRCQECNYFMVYTRGPPSPLRCGTRSCKNYGIKWDLPKGILTRSSEQ